MKIGLTPRQRLFLVFACFTIAVIGFMIKLPSGFRHIDKELHATFYFGAALFLNVLFAKTRLLRHAAIFIALYLFGIAIELTQAYSNRFFRTRIHGRFDPEDVQSNLKGLVVFSVVWITYTALFFIYRRAMKNTRYNSKLS
jgi:VanZ family protein